MDKPVPKPPKGNLVVHWDEAEAWIETKHGVRIRDFAGRFFGHPEAAYQNFWHSILYHCGFIRPGGGSYFSLSLKPEDWEQDWERQIISLIKAEFGEYAQDDSIEFYIYW
jgi:hypothetical protein